MDRKVILDLMSKSSYKPMNLNGFRNVLNLIASDEYVEFIKLMNSLEEEGVIIRSKKDLYYLPEMLNIYKGTIVNVKKNFAFAKLDDYEEEIYISKENLGDAIFKDRVLIEVIKGRTEGRIHQVLSREIKTFVGEYQDGYIIPDENNLNENIYVDKISRRTVSNGYKVVALLEKNNMGLLAHIIEVIGHKDAPGVDILSVLKRYEASTEFPEEVEQELENINPYVTDEEKEGRKDLTKLPFVTIDGEDAKDFDDAIYVKKNAKGYKLYVSIADVSHYVKEKGAIDREAFKRGTSIYLLNKVVPMLPFKLSDDICSLVPNEIRLTMTCEMDFSNEGKLLKHDIYTSYIKSNHRLTYTRVNAYFDGDEKALPDEIKPMIDDARELASIIQGVKKEKGEINLDISESKFVFDDFGHVKEIKARVTDEAEGLIESFMIAANETVASTIYWMKLPFVYRVHDEPDEDKLKSFYMIASALGIKFKINREKVYTKQLADILDLADPETKPILDLFLLRCLAKAKYQVENIGHFGLNSECYTHFTSPIRRYPDLMVHRLLKMYLVDKKYDYNESELINYLIYASEQTSMTERRAIYIEEEVEDMKKAEFMADHLGQVYEGRINSLNSKGIFVVLSNTVEGMLPFDSLHDDYYMFDEPRMQAIGLRTHKVYKIGDKIKVFVESADKDKGRVNFGIPRRKGDSVHGTYKRKSKSKA